MQSLQNELAQVFGQSVIKGTLSAPVPGVDDRRINIRLVFVQGEAMYQFERLTQKQAFHENVKPQEAAAKALEWMQNFRQADLWTKDRQYSFRITKKGKVLSNQRKLDTELKAEASHDRQKKYLLPEGTVIEPLIDLGVFSKEGRLIKSMTDKYRQIERFVEMVEDAIKDEPKDRVLHIVDFGCGKSYLTFVLYYYLTKIRGQKVEMTGLDLKEDVIRQCAGIAEKYGYEHLKFLHGDIADFSSDDPMDMVISLHACDTATDFALYHAISWKSRLILSVPCCQHEVCHQLSNDAIPGLTDYGIIKERMAALVTDGLRADILKAAGYQVQVLEFIDMEHSPKNILIRARYTGKPNEKAREHVEEIINSLHIQPTLYKLMQNED